MIPLTNYDSQWGRSEVVIIYPDTLPWKNAHHFSQVSPLVAPWTSWTLANRCLPRALLAGRLNHTGSPSAWEDDGTCPSNSARSSENFHENCKNSKLSKQQTKYVTTDIKSKDPAVYSSPRLQCAQNMGTRSRRDSPASSREPPRLLPLDVPWIEWQKWLGLQPWILNLNW